MTQSLHILPATRGEPAHLYKPGSMAGKRKGLPRWPRDHPGALLHVPWGLPWPSRAEAQGSQGHTGHGPGKPGTQSATLGRSSHQIPSLLRKGPGFKTLLQALPCHHLHLTAPFSEGRVSGVVWRTSLWEEAEQPARGLEEAGQVAQGSAGPVQSPALCECSPRRRVSRERASTWLLRALEGSLTSALISIQSPF